MSGGFKSLSAHWLGGASAVLNNSIGGIRSLLAPWIGGASAPSTATPFGGFRSLLAYWSGGASAQTNTEYQEHFSIITW